MATGLRQRHNGKRSKKEIRRSDSTPIHSNKSKKPKWIKPIAFLVLYLPIVALFNPTTAPVWLSMIHRPVCHGTCRVKSGDGPCHPIDTDRLLFVRIPKTASTSLLQLFRDQKKGTAAIDLGELEDLVSSIPKLGLPKPTLGYHDPHTRPTRLRQFYRNAAKLLIYPSFTNQLRTIFQGHLHYFDFQHLAPIYYPNKTSIMLPDLVLRLYNQKYPSTLNIVQFTLLRRPQDRLASMYYYDRHGARSELWRKALVEQRGNLTLDACLQDETCWRDENDLARWCNLQTEILCGIECQRGDSDHALEVAKTNLQTKLFFVGLVERLPESLRLLSQRIPTYLEGLPETLPQAKAQHQRPKTLSETSQAKLDELCRYDQALYDYANALLSERLETCQIQ